MSAPATLDQARAEAMYASLRSQTVDGEVHYFTWPELLGEFVVAQKWSRKEMNRAIDALARAGAVELDGEDGQLLLTVLPEASSPPWLRVAA